MKQFNVRFEGYETLVYAKSQKEAIEIYQNMLKGIANPYTEKLFDSKYVLHLNLQSRFYDRDILRDFLINKYNYCGDKNCRDYLVNTAIYKITADENATVLALHEYSKEYFNEYKSRHNVKIEKIENPNNKLINIGVIADVADFETDKYDYYSISAEFKNHCSWHCVRVRK